jgi:S1-C subfamily serine protease
MRKRMLAWMAVIVLSMALGGAIVVGIDQIGSDSGSKTAVITQSVPSNSSGASNAAVAGDLSDLYAKVRPSIVTVRGSNARTGAGGIGSGIILDKQGHILTNNHVVNGFNSLDVVFADGNSYAAKVVGTDPGNDLALIQVNGAPSDELVPAVLGDSDKIKVGQLAVAVGNPLNLSGSVTQGIVSGIGRTLNGNGGRPLRQLIQSDAAINPGNSGGALFNAQGEVIGITTALDNPNGETAFVGIGYSVPINTAKRFLPQLLSGQTVTHAKMGIQLQDLTPAQASTLGLSVDHGVLVTAVENGSAASRAGIRGGSGQRGSAVGDVIVQIDGKDIKTFDDLANYLDTKKPGDKIQVKVIRDNKTTTVDVTLDAWQGNGA